MNVACFLAIVLYSRDVHGEAVLGGQRIITTQADGAGSVFAADLDGDGDLDVLSSSYLDHKIAYYENVYGAGTFGSEIVITTQAEGARAVFSTDLDGDGDMDVLSASASDNKIAWYENVDSAGSFGPQMVITTQAADARAVFSADLDGDGDMDVLSASIDDDKIAWYENLNGLGAFSSEIVITTQADGARSVFAADLDGDGDMDVLSASYLDDTVAWYENLDGHGTFGNQVVITTDADFARSVFAADLDGDGDIDVLSASYLDNKIAWYENIDGSGTFSDQIVITRQAEYAFAVFAADIDGDGDIDVLSASYTDDKIAWYENVDGTGTFGSQLVITTQASPATSVFAGDLDGDGDVDVLSASSLDDKIAWYEQLDSPEPAFSPSTTGSSGIWAVVVSLLAILLIIVTAIALYRSRSSSQMSDHHGRETIHDQPASRNQGGIPESRTGRSGSVHRSPRSPRHIDTSDSANRSQTAQVSGMRLASTSQSEVQPETQMAEVMSSPYQQLRLRNAPVQSAHSLHIPAHDVVKKKPLGSGSTGVVYRGVWRSMDVAIKELHDVDDSLLQEEAQRLADLRPHKHIVLLYGVLSDPPALVLEYCSGGSLDVALYGPVSQSFSPKALLTIAIGCAHGLEHMHAEHLVHRDIAARNVLLDEHGAPKLADFGMSRASEFAERATLSTVLPIKWAAPEQIEDAMVSKASDVFSFGCLLWEIFERSAPWPDLPAIKAAQAVIAGERMQPTKATPAQAALMSRCWTHDRRKRPSASDIAMELKPQSTYAVAPFDQGHTIEAYEETSLRLHVARRSDGE